MARTPFVGRTLELAELDENLEAGERLLTILGPPGAGKSRLAREFLSERTAVRVDCDEIGSATELEAAVAGALGTKPGSVATTVANRGETLLLLDNFSQLAPQAALLESWLDAGPDLAIIVTSRVRLGLDEERAVELRGLAEPHAVELFESRRRGRGTAPLPAAISTNLVRALDGLPLALELAAARARLFTPDELLARIREDLSVLSDRKGRTLEAAIGWSWAQATEVEQDALHHSLVFRGGFAMPAAEAVLGAVGTLSLMERLQDQSLLYVDRGRLSVYSTVAAFIRSERGDVPPDAIERHARYYCELAGSESIVRLVAERRNLESAAEQLAASRRAPILRALARLADRGHGSTRLEQLLEETAAAATDPSVRAEMLGELGERKEAAGDTAAAGELLERAAAAAPSGSEISVRIDVARARSTHLAGQPARARALIGDAIQSAQDMCLDAVVGDALSLSSALHVYIGDLRTARNQATEAVARLSAVGDHRGVASALCYLSAVAASRGQDEEAEAALAEAFRRYAEADDRQGLASTAMFRGLGALNRGELDAASRYLETALVTQRELGLANHAATSLRFLGGVLHERGALVDADARVQHALHHRAQADQRGTAIDHLYAGFIRWDRGLESEALADFDAARAIALGIEDGRTHGRAAYALGLCCDASFTEEARRVLADQDDVESRAILHGEQYPSYVCRALARIRTAAPVMANWPVALSVARDGSAFTTADAAVDLAGKASQRRILAALTAQRLASPGKGLTPDEVLAAGWPGERVLPGPARNRVYVAIRLLRKAGLSGLLVTRDGRYLLDPDQHVCWSK